ncbi:DUF4188 domain-containing protein [Halomarina ordinaria]|uniref:DUF4188 domain-containing protein n=2 Tax=Halomarina ordinaria TaxID=3033939 RepID=A0ABD5UAG6_9EURY
MGDVIHEKVHAEVDEDFVVFLVGMRINKPWRVGKWLPPFLAMPRLLRRLEADPDSGLLGYRVVFSPREPMVVQYWRSAEDLFRAATDPEGGHVPAWLAYNRDSDLSGAAGIWHETYLVRADAYETSYRNMPPFGLGTVGRLAPAKGTGFGRLVADAEAVERPGPTEV